MLPAYEQLANRLRRVHRHLRKWARREDITAWRLYDRDIPDQPLIVEWYDGVAVCWAFDRTRNETAEQEEEWLALVAEAVRAGLDLPAEGLVLKRRRRQAERQEGGQYQRLAGQGRERPVREHGLTLLANLADYLDTGLFLDHRPLRRRVGLEASGRRVLNLFAYTGAFTVHARAGGAARTLTIDLSNTYLDWCGRNLAANRLDPAAAGHDLLRADCLRWLEQRPDEEFDCIVCDPPTFSNSTAMAQSFSVERDHPRLIGRCAARLAFGGVLYFSTNARGFRLAELPPGLRAEDITAATIPPDVRNPQAHRAWRITAG